MNDLHRLQQLIDELFNGNQAAFSRAIHRQPAQVSQYVRERRQVGVEIKQHIEKALDLPGWFECSGTVEEHRAQAAARQLPMFDSTSDYPRPNLAGLRRVPVIGTTQGGFPDRVWTDGDVPVGGGATTWCSQCLRETSSTESTRRTTTGLIAGGSTCRAVPSVGKTTKRTRKTEQTASGRFFYAQAKKIYSHATF
jgi:hypothetical protein